MSNIIDFRARQTRHGNALPTVDLEAAARVSQSVHLKPGPSETPTQFVTRIVRAYKGESGE